MNLVLFSSLEETNRPLNGKDARAKSLLKNLKKTEGDFFEAGVLGGNTGTGRIKAVSPEGDVFFTLELTRPPKPLLPLRLGVGFPRPIQLRRLLRDASSFGAAQIDLLETELGDENYRKTNLLKDGGAQAAINEGLVQSRGTSPPLLRVFDSLESWIKDAVFWSGPQQDAAREKNTYGGALLAACDNARPSRSFSEIRRGFAAAVIAVGPERGWSESERDALEAGGFTLVSMGERALRTETACISACALAAERLASWR
ncbi:MAG: RNA methyltransferase [Spirochaetaceae bacterium]|jgi:RsmE family RNA methyltransferase|nr:RNA methyltransferase [Spirochaetaceae bacterium]